MQIQQTKELQRRFKLLAGGQAIDDVFAVFKILADSIADVRNPLKNAAGEPYSVEARAAAADILTDQIDTLRRIANDGGKRAGENFSNDSL